MQSETLQYIKDKGWSLSTFPQLDSEDTLILIFAAPEFISEPAPIDELTKHYPKSKIIGCSTAGEIYGSIISDHSISVAIIKFERSKLKLVAADIESAENSKQVGQALAHQLNAKDLRGIFVLSEGLNIEWV